MTFNKKSFASDNNSGVHPEIMTAMAAANQGHVIGYGDDPYTEQAIAQFKRHFGEECAVFFVFSGTGANVLGLKAVTHSFHSIICAETSHIQVDECGAPEKFTGCKLLPVATSNGKLTPEQIRPHLHGFDFEHHSQPRVISITQATEMGTVYTVAEMKALADLAHAHQMVLHVDGARIANAAVSLGLDFQLLTRAAGVDILSFGGTKNGLMYGEAVVFFNLDLVKDVKYYRKQSTQLGSKMRFISAQFEAYLRGDLWQRNAGHANRMARLLADSVRDIPQVKITQPVEANGVFAIIPREAIAPLQQEYFFYIWNEVASEVRWMCSFDTTEEDVETFVKCLRKILNSI